MSISVVSSFDSEVLIQYTLSLFGLEDFLESIATTPQSIVRGRETQSFGSDFEEGFIALLHPGDLAKMDKVNRIDVIPGLSTSTSSNEPSAIAQIETECELLGPVPNPVAHSAYESLEPGCIRLSRIWLGGTNSRISIELQTFSLDNAPDYAAISYAWGSKVASWKISVNGREIYVPTNLHRFLTHYRDLTKKKVDTGLGKEVLG